MKLIRKRSSSVTPRSSFCDRERLISAYRALMMSCVSAVSNSVPFARMMLSPANCPALVTFVILMATAAHTGRPPATAIIPNVMDTEK